MTLRRTPNCLIGLLRFLLVVPFLGLSLLPQGVMPGRSADGTLTLTLCTGSGALEVVIDVNTGEPVSPGHGTFNQTCDWATGQVAALGVNPTESAGPPLVLLAFDPVPETFAYSPTYDPCGLWARGPPSST